MQPINTARLPLAVRVYPDNLKTKEQRSNKEKRWRRPDSMFVFDTETRIDATQSFIFGSYRFLQKGECMEEGLFYADDVSESERTTLEQYVSEHNANSTLPRLRLLTRSEFVDKLFKAGYKARSLIVGFNLSFDLSRIAYDVTTARGRFAGGFSLGIWSYVDEDGCEHRNQFRPRIGIKHIDSKRALRGFTSRNEPDKADLIPDESEKWTVSEGICLPRKFLGFAHIGFCINRQRIFARNGVQCLRRDERKNQSFCTRCSHRRIYRLQPS